MNQKTPKRKHDRAYLMPFRYIILLGLMFSLPMLYKVLFVLTIHPVFWLLKLVFNPVLLNGDILLILFTTPIQIIPACVAGSAYLLLLILNFTVPMSHKKRILSITLAFTLLLTANILRIFLLSLLYHYQSPFFDFTHKFFWYFLSTIFVVIIWFLMVKIFTIKEIPVYSDLKYLLRIIKKKR